VKIIEQLVNMKLAENVFSASNMANGLKLADLPTDEAKIERAMLYRKWRPKSDKNDMLPTWQAYDLAIHGIDPDDVKPRQMEFSDAADEYLEAEADHYASYFKDVMDGKAG
jgi:hypothetical protein